MDIKVVYFLIIVLLGLAIAITILTSGQEARVELEKEFQKRLAGKAALVSISGQPVLDPIGFDDCDAQRGSCIYHFNVKGLDLKSSKPLDKMAVVLSYKDKSIVVPCKAGLSPAGPCAVTQQADVGYAAAFEIQSKIEGDFSMLGASQFKLSDGLLQLDWIPLPLPDVPPTINASKNTRFSGILVDEQRLILGNYSFDMNLRSLIQGISLKSAQVTVTCKDDKKIVDLNEKERVYLVMCGKGAAIELQIVGSRVGTFIITVDENPGSVTGDPVTLSFWQYDDVFVRAGCGGMAEERLVYNEQFDFNVRMALITKECSDRFLGGGTVYAPVKSVQPAAQ